MALNKGSVDKVASIVPKQIPAELPGGRRHRHIATQSGLTMAIPEAVCMRSR